MVLFFKVIFEGVLLDSPCLQCGGSRTPGMLPEKLVVALVGEGGVGLQGVVLVSCWAGNDLPGTSCGYWGWHHFWLLRIWEGTVLPVEVDATPKSLEILTCMSILSVQPIFLAFSPCCWIYVPFPPDPFLHYDRNTLFLNEKTKDTYFPVKS